ncbi:MAG TPA: hypothetical protein VG099_17530 [Gemmataceae bacterium]|jgi:hypothetical protein|nr:hypothetical protein [Gemmataceae bacterium]
MSKNLQSDTLGIRLTTYAELEKIIHGFAGGDLNLLILLGGHGLGKSRALRQAMAGQACWLEGNASAFGLYCQLWRHRNRPVVLDDLDGLYANRDGIRLLKSLTQNELHKTVSWYTDAATLQREQIPQEFHTSSRLAIITNEWKTLNRNVAALQDRGHVVIFEPTPQEVHTRTAAWFWDQDIYEFVGERLHLLREPSMRHYVAAWELKQAGLDWPSLLLSRCLSGKALLVAQLKASPKYVSEAERVRAFVASGAGSRATYFQLCKELRGPLPKGPSIRLQCQAPPRPRADHEMLGILRKWRGNLGNN